VRQLYLLRHAKSSWDEPLLADHDRPLAPRGRKAAKRIGAHVRREQSRVGLVLCSSARRARDTLELLALPGDARIERGLHRFWSTLAPDHAELAAFVRPRELP
jgi:phosphohistidine phosphatase